MKKTLVRIALVLAACCARGQGTLQFDQSISPTNAPGSFFNIQPDPTGQSFVPALSSVGFVQLYFEDPTQVQGPTLFVDLWSGALGSGTLLGQSGAVSLSTSFVGIMTFYFATPIAVTPGTTYYLQPVIQSGDSEQIGVVGGSSYANGMAFLSGTAQPGGDLWFREGVVPEPSSFSLAVLGLFGICFVLRKRHNLNHSKESCSEERPSPYSRAPH